MYVIMQSLLPLVNKQYSMKALKIKMKDDLVNKNNAMSPIHSS